MLFAGRSLRARRRHRDRRRHREISRRHDALGRLAADAADQGSGLAASRQILRHGLRAARAAPACRRSAPGRTPIWRRRGRPCSTCSPARTSSTPTRSTRKATTYVLSALEPPGSVPDLTRLPRGGVGAALYNVERSLGSILSFSFFITKQMKIDLHAGQISGTLPILYVFLARSGKTIRSVTSGCARRQGRGVFRQRKSRAERGARRAHHLRRHRWRGKDAVLFLDRSFQFRRQGERLPEVLLRRSRPATACSRARPICCTPATSPRCATSSSPTAPPSSRTIPEFRSPITVSEKWRFFPFGRYAGPIDEFPGRISNPMPNCSGARSRSISASAIAGAPMNRICCCRCRLPDDGSASPEATSSTEAPPPPPPRPEKPRPPAPIGPQRGGFFWFGR